MGRELSIFIDESGDFGTVKNIAPYYIISLVFHEQNKSITEQIQFLDNELMNCSNLGKHTVHTAPLIRRESLYSKLDIKERFNIFNKLFHFTRKVDITYKTIIVEKKYTKNQLDISNQIAKQLSSIIRENLSYFEKFDNIIIYYDNGQQQLANTLVTIFSSWFADNFEYRVVNPDEYKLFQSADLICTLALLNQKIQSCAELTKSEIKFFGSKRKIKNNYIRKLVSKKFE